MMESTSLRRSGMMADDWTRKDILMKGVINVYIKE